jgi:hypothetical protein
VIPNSALAPTSVVRRVLGALLGVSALGGILLGSHAAMTAHAGTGAVLRVSWSARPERIDVCRRVSEEELAQLAPHMRRQVVCEGTTARYLLEVRRDGVVLDTAIVRGGGLRHDRELYVARDLPIAAARARIVVRFARLDSSAGPTDTGQLSGRAGEPATPRAGGAAAAASASTDAPVPQGVVPADRAVREAEERERRRAEAVPPVLVLDTIVALAPRTVLLVTYDALARRLVVKGER